MTTAGCDRKPVRAWVESTMKTLSSSSLGYHILQFGNFLPLQGSFFSNSTALALFLDSPNKNKRKHTNSAAFAAKKIFPL